MPACVAVTASAVREGFARRNDARFGLEEAAARAERLVALRDTLKSNELTFELRADEHGSTFGSVTKENILSALRERDWLGAEKIDVLLPHPIKSLGEHQVELGLDTKTRVQLRIRVQASSKK